MKKNHLCILIALIVLFPFGARASLGDSIRAKFGQINLELDSAGNQVATALLSLNTSRPLGRQGFQLEQNNGMDVFGEQQAGAGPNSGLPSEAQDGQANQNNQSSGSTNVPRDIDPTFCNVQILLPQANQTVPSSFTTAGIVGALYGYDMCAWSVFEANAGEVQVFDENGVSVSHKVQLHSVGDWMQSPSSFEGSIILTSIPHTQTGYLHYVEHPIQDGAVADTFDLPITFEVWQQPRQPGEQTMFGRFFSTIADLFTSKPVVEETPIQTTLKPDKPTAQDIRPLDQLGDNASDIINSVENSGFSGQLYCEISLPDDSKFCSGNRINADTCRCQTFYLSDGVQRGREDVSPINNITPKNIDELLLVPIGDINLSKTLYFGDRGDEVRMLESSLYYFGYYENVSLGLFNNDLRLSLREFAKTHGENISGFIVTKKIRNMINEAVSILNNHKNQ